MDAIAGKCRQCSSESVHAQAFLDSPVTTVPIDDDNKNAKWPLVCPRRAHTALLLFLLAIYSFVAPGWFGTLNPTMSSKRVRTF